MSIKTNRKPLHSFKDFDFDTHNKLIERFGNPVVIENKPGMAPTAIIFFAAAILSVLTLIPMLMAAKQKKSAQ